MCTVHYLFWYFYSLPPSLSTSQYCLLNCIIFRIPGFHIWTISCRSFCWWHWSQLFSRGCWIYTYPLLRCCYWCKHIRQNSFTCMFLSQLMGENSFSVEQHTYAEWTKPSVSPLSRLWDVFEIPSLDSLNWTGSLAVLSKWTASLQLHRTVVLLHLTTLTNLANKSEQHLIKRCFPHCSFF